MVDLVTDRALTDDEVASLLGSALIASDRGYQPQVTGGSMPDILGRLGHLMRGRDMRDFLNLNPGIEDRTLELCWRWVGMGIIRPWGSSADSFVPTLSGRRYLEAIADGTEIIYTPGRFVAGIEERCPGIDEISSSYAGYAHGSFLAGQYVAAVVLLGAASETLLLRLADAVEAAREPLGLTGSNLDPELLASKRQDRLKQLFEENRRPLERAIDTSLVSEVPRVLGFANAIRVGRNDAGHPRRLIDRRDQAFELLNLFPAFAEVVVAATHRIRAAAS